MSPLLVAIDDGYAQTKLYGQSSAADGAHISRKLRSSVRSGRHAIGSLSGDGAIASYVTDEGENITVSDAVDGETTQFDGFHTSALNRVLVHHALLSAGYGRTPVKLIVGLPVGDYFSGTRRDDAKIEAKKANLQRTLRSAIPGDSADLDLVSVRVGCQAVAAFVDYLTDDDGEQRDVPTDRVAVVDIGGRTTDIALILGGETFDPSRSGTDNIGALDVYRGLSERIRKQFNTRDDYPSSMLDKAVREGFIKLWGKPFDVSSLVADAVQEQQARIARQVAMRLGSGSDIDTILFTGGGANLFSGLTDAFPNATVAPDPEFANARGLFKFALETD